MRIHFATGIIRTVLKVPVAAPLRLHGERPVPVFRGPTVRVRLEPAFLP